MTWGERAERALEQLKREPTACLGDIAALEHTRDSGHEPYYPIKYLIVSLEEKREPGR